MTAARKRPLKIGIMLPDTERELAGKTARWADLATMAKVAEDVGFDSLWVSDHLIFRFPEKEPQGIWECWSLLAALAAVTTRVEIGPLVSCTSFRNPALLAKMAATVDEISGGRLILGLGAGWHAPEYQAFGYPFDHRVSRFEEALKIIHDLLRHGHVDFEGGAYHSARACELRPQGPRPDGIPIMIGSIAPKMLGLLVEYGDIWNAWGKNSPREIAEPREIVDAACVAAGRDPKTLQRTVSVLVDLPGAAGRPRESGQMLSGSSEELAETCRAYAREGISHLQLVLDPNTPAGIEALAPVLEILDGG